MSQSQDAVLHQMEEDPVLGSMCLSYRVPSSRFAVYPKVRDFIYAETDP
jgi:hypothetical protein